MNPDEQASEIERIIEKACGSSLAVSEELLPLVYDELRTLAAKQMSGERAGHTLQATALVHEAWIRLTEVDDHLWNDRKHFFRAAALAMRRILISRARAKACKKRGERAVHLQIDDLEIVDENHSERIIAVHEMLEELEKSDPESARIITLKFFGGLTNKEISEVDGVSERTIERKWAYARVCLYKMIKERFSE